MSLHVAPELHNYINGAFVPPQSGAFLDDHAPATGRLLTRVPRSGPADVHAAVRAARDAFDSNWRWSAPLDRAALLDRVADRLERHLDTLAAMESQDTGKPISLARSIDIPRAVSNFRFFAGAIRHDRTDCHEMAGALNYTIRRPLGVVALISPWNLPLYLLSWKVAPALAMGNTVVAKPSELTPLTANALAEILHECGLPDGVFNLVHGFGPEAGAALVSHPEVAAVSFTGGTATGASVAAAAAPSFKKLSLELGGKNPTVVFADADLEAAAAGAATAGFRNQGQICLCGSRVLVEREVIEPFTEALVERVNALKIGDPADPSSDLGALVSLAHRDKVEGYLKLAVEEGGTILCGGDRPSLPPPLDQGAFLRPAVIGGLAPTCRTATEEIFGPVVTVHPFDTEAEALAMANGVRFGLAASVWTQNLSRAHRFSGALETGMVWVNTWMHRDLRVPFGGMKDSGMGREGGFHSLEFFSEARNICVKL